MLPVQGSIISGPCTWPHTCWRGKRWTVMTATRCAAVGTCPCISRQSSPVIYIVMLSCFVRWVAKGGGFEAAPHDAGRPPGYQDMDHAAPHRPGMVDGSGMTHSHTHTRQTTGTDTCLCPLRPAALWIPYLSTFEGGSGQRTRRCVLHDRQDSTQ